MSAINLKTYLSMRVEAIEEAFSCFLVHRPETDKIQTVLQELQSALNELSPEQQEPGVKQFLTMAGTMKNHSRLQLLFSLLESLLKALENVIEYIFNRNACLLPGYFIVNEVQKGYPDNKTWPHWKLANLLSSFVESFRPTAQMVSIIGHSKMLPVVEHSGYANHLINSWKLDPTTLKFSLKGNLPYEKSLLEPQTGLLRWVLEQPYSRDMVCSMLGLQKQHKQRCVALEEQLVELMILAMERSEAETAPVEGEDMTNSHWLWLHLSSQLIYFVLFQFATFPNIVMALHDKVNHEDNV
ncbi:mediator of RNA polymerase II transcription subunit 23-like [Lycorma delicatula]|uniref:mediator of RNA polymerase II transcription subunit 23-like n=1 Tax=Lycorma delicatula TaxID=130591 RepID=UPI003F50D6AE